MSKFYTKNLSSTRAFKTYDLHVSLALQINHTLSYHTLCFHTFHFYLVFHCTFQFVIATWMQPPKKKQNTDELLVVIFHIQNWWNVTQNPTLWDQYNMRALSRLHVDQCLISKEITLADVFHLKSRTAGRGINVTIWTLPAFPVF